MKCWNDPHLSKFLSLARRSEKPDNLRRPGLESKSKATQEGVYMTDFYDEWLRNELWTFEEAAMLFNDMDPQYAKGIGFKYFESRSRNGQSQPRPAGESLEKTGKIRTRGSSELHADDVDRSCGIGALLVGWFDRPRAGKTSRAGAQEDR